MRLKNARRKLRKFDKRKESSLWTTLLRDAILKLMFSRKVII